MDTTCGHTCRGLCNALSVAEQREREAVEEYRYFIHQCDYPDVRVVLERLMADRQRALQILKDTRAMLDARFFTTDRINDSFA